MGLSVWHVLVVLVVVLILFGAGKLPQVMGDLAKGIKNFKAGMAEDGSKDGVRNDGPEAAGVTRQSGLAAPEAANSDAARAPEKTATGGKS